MFVNNNLTKRTSGQFKASRFLLFVKNRTTLSFQKRAVSEGGNAVVNIRSYYKKHEVSSRTEFECGAGAIIAGVTFKGDVVQLAQ